MLLFVRDKLEENGVCVRVLGKISLLPDDLQILIAEAVSMTSHHNRFVPNVNPLIKENSSKADVR